MVSGEMLEKFKKLYLNKYNVLLTDEEATEMTTALVNLMKILLKPEPSKYTCESNSEEGGENEVIQPTLF